MKKIFICLCVALPSIAFSAADSYRVAWRSDPATSAVICWNQVSGNNPEVCYDTVDHGQKAEAYASVQLPDRVTFYRGMTNQFVRLENLKADTAYYFVVRDSEGVGRRLWFRTAPDKPQPFTFISGGDSRTNPEPRRAGNRLVAKLRPLFILFGGDYTVAGKPEEWKEWLADWQLTISEDGRIYPIIATHGNHENADMQMMESLFDTPHPDQYYSMGIAGDMMRVWVLNSELEYKAPLKVSDQNKWINSDLPKYSNTTWKVATYHRPMRAHTAHKQEGLNRIKWWAELFHENAVDLVVESDTHMTKQTYPIRPSEDPESYESFVRDDESGIVFIGEGSWGAPKRPANDDKPWTMASESFHQYKWIQAFPDELLIRTVKFDHVDAVVSLTDTNLFEEPEHMVFWEPETGKILRLPFDARHFTYNKPVPAQSVIRSGESWAWSLHGEIWADGEAPLGYGDDAIVTTVSADNTKPQCVFFSKEFNVENVAAVSRLFFDVKVDDGCVIKLNGKVVVKHNMPDGQLTSNSMATETVSGWAERKMIPFPIDPVYLIEGINVIDVRVHQVSSESTDLIFDMGVRIKK